MAPTQRKPLSPERIVDAALQLVDLEGTDALSMRRLARSLRVEPMSLYHWFPSRDHLMDALLDAFVGGIEVPSADSLREQLGSAARSFRAQARRHPGLLPFVATHRFNTVSALAVLEQVLGAMVAAHPDPAKRAAAFRLWIHWLIGFCLDEASGFSKGPSAQNPPSDAEVALRFPHVAALGPFNQPQHFDALFEQGLDTILQAIAGSSTRHRDVI